MPSSSAIVQKMLGYKCIAPGCEKMFDSRKGYNMHRWQKFAKITPQMAKICQIYWLKIAKITQHYAVVARGGTYPPLRVECVMDLTA